MYLYTGRGGFKVMERKEVERQAQARHALPRPGAWQFCQAWNLLWSAWVVGRVV